MHPVLAQEWPGLLEVYPGTQHVALPDRLLLEVPLLSGLYNRQSTPVAVLIPPGYRSTGPDGFLVPAGLQLVTGQQLPVSDAAGLGLVGWWLMSFHMLDAAGQSTWKPSADPSRGDNMMSYISEIEDFLSRSCN